MTPEPVYQSDADMLPDEAFEPGVLAHVVEGNGGRLLDPRRTPVTVVDVRPDTGFMLLRLEAFEDKGAIWEVTLESIRHYQFRKGSRRADAATVARLESAVRRFDRPLTVPVRPEARKATAERLAGQVEAATAWLERSSRFVSEGAALPDPQTRRGDPRLFADLAAWMQAHDAWDLEQDFARQYVRNPESGELVKGHRIVIAELGLAEYAGRVVRSPDLFEGRWTKPRRAAHVVARLAFVRALLRRLGLDTVRLYRGMSCTGPLRPPGNDTFISTTFCEQVARSHYEADEDAETRILISRAVPAARVFMTYLEAEAMNDTFLEAEAVLLHDEHERAI
jgi:hypothetical protein